MEKEIFSNRTLGNFVVVGVGVFLIIMLSLHVLEPEFNPIERTMSEYVLGHIGWLFTVSTLCLLIGSSFLAYALTTKKILTAPTKFGLTLLWIWSVAMGVAAIFPTDAFDPNAIEFSISPTGFVHALAGLVGSLSLPVAAFLITRQIGKDSRWDFVKELLSVLSLGCIIGEILFIITVVAQPALEQLFGYPSLYGIGERLAMMIFAVWLITMGLGIRALDTVSPK